MQFFSEWEVIIRKPRDGSREGWLIILELNG